MTALKLWFIRCGEAFKTYDDADTRGMPGYEIHQAVGKDDFDRVMKALQVAKDRLKLCGDGLGISVVEKIEKGECDGSTTKN